MDQQYEAEFADFLTGVSRRLLHAGDLLTGDRARGEDLVQDALAIAYARWPSIRAGNPEAYVRRIMLHRYLDWWRRRRWRERPLPEVPEAGFGPVIQDHAALVVRRDAVQRALAQLSARERAVVVLRYWLDLSEEQIAAELRIAPGTVKSTSNRALTKLRRSPDLTWDPDPGPAEPITFSPNTKSPNTESPNTESPETTVLTTNTAKTSEGAIP